jgi:hypothetical protein
MSPCYNGHRNSSEGTKRDLKQQKHNDTQGEKIKGLEEEERNPRNKIQTWSEMNMKLDKTEQ